MTDIYKKIFFHIEPYSNEFMHVKRNDESCYSDY